MIAGVMSSAGYRWVMTGDLDTLAGVLSIGGELWICFVEYRFIILTVYYRSENCVRLR